MENLQSRIKKQTNQIQIKCGEIINGVKEKKEKKRKRRKKKQKIHIGDNKL